VDALKAIWGTLRCRDDGVPHDPILMAQDNTPLVWIDMEMSGLVPERERILEVAVVVTDAELAVIAEAPVYVVHQPDEILDAMDSWNRSTHGKSGLVEKVRASTFTEAEVEARLVDFLKPVVGPGVAPLAGNTVHQDRRFMARYMPALDAYLHYRIVDVSTLKELARRWRPDVLQGLVKEGKHEALADIHESIAELRHYRATFLRLEP
jgi:oligoribonuclease